MHATTARHVQLMAVASAAITLDGGRTWRAQRLPCSAQHQADMTLPSFGAGYLICNGPGAGGEDDILVYRTLDNGAHWVKVHSGLVPGDPAHVAIDSGGQPVLTGGRVASLVSSDGGHTWRRAEPPGSGA